ncbi:hypothetical protein ACFL2Q_11220 [Thermodesulfobacteriota bacterium]
MIDRSLVGKAYPSFEVTITQDLSLNLRKILGLSTAVSDPPLVWPKVLTLHGTACLMPIWEDLGVNPLHVRTVGEKFRYGEAPRHGEELTGTVFIDWIEEGLDPDQGIVEQIDINVVFHNSRGKRIATYEASFRVAVAAIAGTSQL